MQLTKLSCVCSWSKNRPQLIKILWWKWKATITETDNDPHKVTKAVARRDPMKKVLSQNLQENTFVGTSGGNFIWKETPTQMFSCEFCEIFKNTFLIERVWKLVIWFAIYGITCCDWPRCKNKFNKKTLCVVTIAMICSSLALLWKFQYFRRSIYNPVEYLWWSFYCKNSEPLSIFTKKLHHRYLLGF